jgi:hypothetical protein
MLAKTTITMLLKALGESAAMNPSLTQRALDGRYAPRFLGVSLSFVLASRK